MHGKRKPGRGQPAAGRPVSHIGLLFRFVGRLLAVTFVCVLAPAGIVLLVSVYCMLALTKLALTPPKGGD